MLVVFTVPALRLHTPEMGKHRNRMKKIIHEINVQCFHSPSLSFIQAYYKKCIILFRLEFYVVTLCTIPPFLYLNSCLPTTWLLPMCDPPRRTWCRYKRSKMTVVALQHIWLNHGWACFVNSVVQRCAVIACECGRTKICICASFHLVTIIAYSLFVIP